MLNGDANMKRDLMPDIQANVPNCFREGMLIEFKNWMSTSSWNPFTLIKY